MKRAIRHAIFLILIGAMFATPASAQPGPGGGGPGGGGPRGDGPRGDGARRGPGGADGDFGPGGGGPGMGRGPMNPEFMKLQMLRDYLDVVDRLTRMSRDPASSGVAAVVAASDLLRARGTDAAIEYFNKALPDVKNETVQRAIRIQLIDLYKQSGQADKALEQMDKLLKGAPAGAGMPPTGDTPAPR